MWIYISVTPELSRNEVFADESYPYWHLKLKLQLSTETLPRYYQVGILRSVLPQASRGNDKETILVTYYAGKHGSSIYHGKSSRVHPISFLSSIQANPRYQYCL